MVGNAENISLTVNGTEHTVSVPHHASLLDVLRDLLGLTGAKRGCDRGECGSCTVLLDGIPVNACQVLALRSAGCSVLTVEGLLDGGELSPLQRAFLDEDGGQCGFCTPGFVMAARALLYANRIRPMRRRGKRCRGISAAAMLTDASWRQSGRRLTAKPDSWLAAPASFCCSRLWAVDNRKALGAGQPIVRSHGWFVMRLVCYDG